MTITSQAPARRLDTHHLRGPPSHQAAVQATLGRADFADSARYHATRGGEDVGGEPERTRQANAFDTGDHRGIATLIPRKAQRIALPARASVSQAAHVAIAEGRAHFLHNVQGLKRPFSPELVHQTRVALRRLRVFVRVFRSRIGKQRAGALRVELRWLFVPLGELRDLQLFVHDLLPASRALTGPERALRVRLAARIESASVALAEALQAPRLSALCAELAALEADLERSGRDRKRARRWLARRLERQRRRALNHFEAVLRRDPLELHSLRKTLKKLRYTADLARGLYDDDSAQRARNYLRSLRALQDVLGALVDAQVAGSIVADAGATPALSRRLIARLERGRASRLRELDACFQRFADADPFWA
jgi:CHAD domain-containing protein